MVQTAASARPEARPNDRVLARKRQILEAASRVFRRRGLHAAGMRDIAAELDMAVGNLYYYFKDKHEILAFCQDDSLAGLLELAESVAAAPARPDQRLALLIVGHLVRIHRGTPGSLAHLEVEALRGEWRRAVIARRDEYEGVYKRVIADGVEAGVFRNVDAGLATRAILGALNWTARWYDASGPHSPRQVGEAFADQLVGGIMATGVERLPPDEALLELAELTSGTGEEVDSAG